MSGNYTRILGIPFVPAADSPGSLMYSNFTGNTTGNIVEAIVTTATVISMQNVNANGIVGAAGLNSSLLQQTASFDFNGTYFV